METMILSSLNNEDPVLDPSFAILKLNSGLSLDWTREEQSILEEGLARYSSNETKVVQYYSKIAYDLDNKTIRDVALRVKFMNTKENSKRRKGDHKLIRKSNDEKEKVLDSSHFVAQPNVTPYAPATIMTDNGDGISCQSIADSIAQIKKALNQISENVDTLELQANIPLFCQTRENIMTIWNDLKDEGEMKGLPPFDVDMDVTNSILAETTFPKQ